MASRILPLMRVSLQTRLQTTAAQSVVAVTVAHVVVATVVLAETTTRSNSSPRILYEFSRNFTVPAVFFLSPVRAADRRVFLPFSSMPLSLSHRPGRDAFSTRLMLKWQIAFHNGMPRRALCGGVRCLAPPCYHISPQRASWTRLARAGPTRAAMSSTEAAAMRATLPKCIRRRCSVFSPTPGMS